MSLTNFDAIISKTTQELLYVIIRCYDLPGGILMIAEYCEGIQCIYFRHIYAYWVTELLKATLLVKFWQIMSQLVAVVSESHEVAAFSISCD